MWNDQKLEIFLKEKLAEEYDKRESEEYYSSYIEARKYIVDEVLKEIKAIEPDLTDHSADHVANVMQRAWDLIEDDLTHFSAIEIYLLCHIILFHDVGNIEGRGNHNKKVADIYNIIRKNIPKYHQERILILRATSAHCGDSKRGDKDTLSDVDEYSNLYGKQVKLRELASILRLADELAEGPQRTSYYMLAKEKIKPESKVYHEYASITNIYVDKGNGRIPITYNIDFSVVADLPLLLNFTYGRILKLDEERRYCKYYSNVLTKLKKTEIKINFTIDGNLCDFDLPKIELEDKYNFVERGEDSETEIETFIKIYPSFNIDNIVEYLNKSNQHECTKESV